MLFRSRIDGDPARALALHRGDLVAEALNSLRASAQTELQGVEPPAPPALRSKAAALADELDAAGNLDVHHHIVLADQRQLRAGQGADAESFFASSKTISTIDPSSA